MYNKGNDSRLTVKNDQRLGLLVILEAVFLSIIYYRFGINFKALFFISGFEYASFYIMAAISSVSAASILLPSKYATVRFYLSSLTLLIFVGLFFLSLHSGILLIISLLLLIPYSYYWFMEYREYESALKKLLTFSAAILFMYFVGNLLHFFISPISYPSTFVPIQDQFAPPGGRVPFLLYYGISVYSPLFQISLSPVSLLMFSLISSILTENYFSIFRLLRKGNGKTKIQGTAYGVISLLSCQCEGGISLLPTMAVLIISISMIPVIGESFLLLLLTNILINRYYIKGSSVRFLVKFGGLEKKLAGIILAAALFIGTPIAETFGIYLGLLSNIFFFFGIGILMTVSAYYEAVVVGKLLDYHRSPHPALLSALFLIGSIFMFIWYIPTLTISAVENVSVFLIMNLTSVVAGIAFGIVRLSTKKTTRQLLDEFIALMFGMPPIIVFYLSAMSNLLIWPTFGITEQIEFGIIIWAILLPFMWLTTNISLNDAGNKFTEIIIPRIERRSSDPE